MTTPLDVALSQLGVKEAPGNKGIPFTRYGLHGEEPLPWCARFVRWCFWSAGTPLPGQRYLIASVETMRDELQKRGALLALEQRPEPGDIIFLTHRSGSDAGTGRHVGIIELVTDSKVTSIDGNYGDAVRRVTRNRGDADVDCFARYPIRAAG